MSLASMAFFQLRNTAPAAARLWKAMFRGLPLQVAGSIAARVISLVSTAACVRVAMQTLGPETYGIYAVVLSSTTLLTYADLGLGMALVNRVAYAIGQGNVDAARTHIRQTSQLLIVSAAMLMAGGAVTFLACFWLHLINRDALHVGLIAIALTTIAIPLGLSQRIFFATGRVFTGNCWLVASRLATICLLPLVSKLGWGLDGLVAVTLGAPLIVYALSFLPLLTSEQKLLTGGETLTLSAARRLVPEGFRYLSLQVMYFLDTGVDVLIIGWILGISAVADYDLTSRFFTYVVALVAVGTQPIWPAIAASIARGTLDHAARLERRATMATAIITFGVCLVLVFATPKITEIWTHHRVTYGILEISLIAAVSGMLALNSLQANILAAREKISRLAKVQASFLVLALCGKVLSLSTFGIVGMLCAAAAVSGAKTLVLLSPRMRA